MIPPSSFRRLPLRGRMRPVSDKSLTHRGLIFGALAAGTTQLDRPNPGRDCSATAEALRRLGASITPTGSGVSISGGIDRFRAAEEPLDLGNSGTGMRLLAGVLAGCPFSSILTGDDSLRRRPMNRIIEPLRAMGATIDAEPGGRAPLRIRGGELNGIDYQPPMASAQVKSAVLLAGLLAARAPVTVREPVPTRDHTERMLRFHGASIENEPGCCRLEHNLRERSLQPGNWTVPGDPSAAAFFAVGAALAEGSDLIIEQVGLNPTRTGAFDVLKRMGARIEIDADPPAGPEPVGRVHVRGGALRAAETLPEDLPRLVDEIPVLALAAALAEGMSVFRGLDELRHKESDRIESTLDLLHALGARAEVDGDTLRVHGGRSLSGGAILTRGDHRIAMTAYIAQGLVEGPVEIDDPGMIATSDPTFHDTLERLR